MGVFSAWFRGHYQLELISGIEGAARRLSAQVIYFSGRSLHSPHPYENDRNIVYDIALNASLDGLIVLSLLANYCDDSALTEFISRYEGIPVVTVNLRAEIGNAILTNNTTGFSALMKHLIGGHGLRKLAFVQGPEHNLDASERFGIYVSALSASGIPYDPALVAAGNYRYGSGQEAVRTFLDERRLVPGADVEAIVCANDAMACGVIDELYDRGVRVPGDIAVTGFDNMGESVFPKPPLTTVSQHLREIGDRAVCDILDYEPHREPFFFDTELVIRRSCGCPRPVDKAAFAREPDAAPDPGRTGDPEVHKRDLEFLFHEIITIIDNLKVLQKTSEFAGWMRSHFPALGINSAWLFLYSGVSPGTMPAYKCIAGYDAQEPGGEMPAEVPENRIFDEILIKKKNRSFCILPLLFKEEKYGILVIEVNTTASLVYDTLSHHVGSSIKNMLLAEEVTAVNQKLRQSNEQKTQFFINVAHETKTPLTLIQNYLALYMERHEQDDKLLVIKQNIDLLLANMLNFLESEKLQKGETIYRHDTFVDLSEGARRKCALFEAIAAGKNIRIIMHAEDRVIIRIDPWALDRIFNNLLDNAVKYTQEGGRVTLDVAAADGKAVLCIRDNGPGLPADTSEHIFEPYYLLSKKGNRQQGTGVGLSIVKKIVDGLGAAITVEKTGEGGTCFTIAFTDCSREAGGETLQEIPAPVQPRIPVRDGVEERDIRADKRSLFIIDDNIQLLKFVQAAFADSYNVFLARNSTEALARLKIIPRPDLIVSDVMMDGADGFELLSALSSVEGYNDIPFIFLTALGGENEKLKGLDLGAVDYIEKPFSIATLRAKIESIIALRARQEKQDRERMRNKIDGLFSGSDRNALLSVKSGFERTCEKYGIVGREREIIRMLMAGLVNKEIASFMSVSQRAVEYHITKIYKKCGVNNKFDLLNKFQG